MISQEGAIEYMKEAGLTNWLITDASGKKIYKHLDAQMNEDSFERLGRLLKTIQPGSKFIIKAGNQSCADANFSGAHIFECIAQYSPVHVPGVDAPPTQMLGGSNDALWQERLNRLEDKYKYQASLDEINRKLDEKGNGWEDVLNDPMKLGMVANTFKGILQPGYTPNSGLAGAPQEPQGNTLSLEGEQQNATPEQVAECEQLMGIVTAKVPLHKINTLLKIIAKKPEVVDQALAMLKT